MIRKYNSRIIDKKNLSSRGQQRVHARLWTEPGIPGEIGCTRRLRDIVSSWCQRSGSTLGESNRGPRVVAAGALSRALPISRSSPVIGWGFKMSCQCQNYPHYRFQITIHNVCRKRGNSSQHTVHECKKKGPTNEVLNQKTTSVLQVAEIRRNSSIKIYLWTWFTSCGYVRHPYVSRGNELQDLVHILPAFFFVLWRNMNPI